MDTLQIALIVLGLMAVAVVGWLVVRWAPPEELESLDPELIDTRTATRMGAGLSKTSESLGRAMRSAFRGGDGDMWDGLEEALIAADVGVGPATAIVDRVKSSHPENAGAAREALRQELIRQFEGRARDLELGPDKPAVVMVVGVNGAGKTTTIAKLAHRLKADGMGILLGAADTFRAAADKQLRTWGERLDVDVVGGQEGADPAAVAFDAYQAGRARGRDVVIVDTAGRLQSKQNLMAELTKIRRVVEREAGAVDEVLLVLDATAGQNGISQAKEFAAAVNVTGIVLTKLDGTARGGVVIAVEEILDTPVKYIGLGEDIESLIPFIPEEFVGALMADA